METEIYNTDIQLIITYLLNPMEELRGWKYNEAQAKVLAKELASYSGPTLQKKAENLAINRKYNTAPSIAEIIAAMKPQATVKTESGVGNYQVNDYEKRKAERDDLNLYVQNFMQSNPLADQARKEGWLDKLDIFVQHTAWSMQTIMLEKNPARGIPYSNLPVPSSTGLSSEYVRLLIAAKNKIRQEQKFDVLDALPEGLISYWKTNVKEAV